MTPHEPSSARPVKIRRRRGLVPCASAQLGVRAVAEPVEQDHEDRIHGARLTHGGSHLGDESGPSRPFTGRLDQAGTRSSEAMTRATPRRDEVSPAAAVPQRRSYLLPIPPSRTLVKNDDLVTGLAQPVELRPAPVRKQPDVLRHSGRHVGRPELGLVHRERMGWTHARSRPMSTAAAFTISIRSAYDHGLDSGRCRAGRSAPAGSAPDRGW